MNKNIINWLKKNIVSYEILPMCDRKGFIIFIPISESENKLSRYFRNKCDRIRYAANYTYYRIDILEVN